MFLTISPQKRRKLMATKEKTLLPRILKRNLVMDIFLPFTTDLASPFQINQYGGRKLLLALKEGRYLAKEGVFSIQKKPMQEESRQKKIANNLEERIFLKPRSDEKVSVEPGRPKISDLNHPPSSPRKTKSSSPSEIKSSSPPKMKPSSPPTIRPGSSYQNPKTPESNSPVSKMVLSPVSQNQPNLTPPVNRRPYFKTRAKGGKKLNFTVEQ